MWDAVDTWEPEASGRAQRHQRRLNQMVRAVVLVLVIVASASATAGVQHVLSAHGGWPTNGPLGGRAQQTAQAMAPMATSGISVATTEGQPGQAILGATLPDFETAYGQPDTPVEPATGFVAFQFGTVAIGLDVVDVPAATYAQRVITITLGQGAQQPRVWDLSHGKTICQELAPPDAHRTGEMALTSEGHEFGIADSYTSPWLAARFPAEDFSGAQQQAAPLGSFTITYTYADDNDPQDLDNCQLSLGVPPPPA
jgi:hypothetical protein